MRASLCFFVALTLIGRTSLAASPWTIQASGITERLRGVSTVDDRVVWASGNHGTCVRTTDGGATWERLAVPDSAGLDFRDVEAFDASTAYLLAIGPGEASRVFKTTNGGATWVESYRNHDPRGFLDAIAFWDRDHGLALGDPVDGRFVILVTEDGGKTWDQASGEGTMPAALANEGAFAASGTCLVAVKGDLAWFGTGGGSKARVFRSTDRGRSWTAAETPVRAAEPSKGIFGLAFRDELTGIAIGGDYRKVDETGPNLAVTTDGGRTWPELAPGDPRTREWAFRSAVAFLPGRPPGSALAVGPSRTDLASDGGGRWLRLSDDPEGWHALAVSPSGRFAWAVGEAGRVGRVDLDEVFKGR